MNEIVALFSVLLLMASAAGWGSITGLILGRPSDSLHETLILGSGTLGTITLIVGFFHFSFALILAMLILGLLHLVKARPTFGLSRDWILLIPSSLIGMVLLLSALALPAADTRHDAIRYHLLGPRVWLFEGTIHPLAHESHTAFPALLETLFAMVLSIGGDSAPGLLGVGFLFLLVAEAGAFAKKLSFSHTAQRAAQIFVTLMPLATNTVEEAFVDVPFAVFVIAGLRFALTAKSSGSRVLAGLCLGFACGTKYTGLIAVLNVLLILSLDVFRRRESLRGIGELLLLSAVGAPCYVRNLIQFHTPIFPPPPVLSSIFPVRGMDAAEIDAFHVAIYTRGTGLGSGLLDFILLPFNLTLFPAWFHGAGGMGLIPLAFAPLGLYLARFIPEARAVIAWTMLSIFTWFITQQEFRFFLPMAVILTVFAASAFDAIYTHAPRFTKVVAAITVAVSLIYTAIWTVRVRLPRIAAAISTEAAEARWRAGVHDSRVIDFLNSDPSVKRIFVLRSSVPAFFLTKPFHIWTPASGDVFIEAERFGATHILDSKLGRWVLPEQSSWRPVYDENDARVYLRSELNSGS